MKKILLVLSLFTLTSTLSFVANAEDKEATLTPIFVTPYKQPSSTYQSRVPTIVTSNSKKRVTAPAGTKSKYQIVNDPNPFEGTSFGRIRTEQDFYDKETKQYHNQYDYMALLAKRGENAKLNAVAQNIQKNGVFDPKKYQAAIMPQPAVTTDPNGVPVVQQQTQNAPVKPNFVLKNPTNTTTPVKTHAGYDDDTTINPAAEKAKNAPIFLR